MKNDRNFFTEFDGRATDRAAVANEQYMTSEGVGNGYLYCHNKKIPVKDVLSVSTLESNLLLVKKLIKQGNVVRFEDNSCIISKGKHVLAGSRIVNDLYQLTNLTC